MTAVTWGSSPPEATAEHLHLASPDLFDVDGFNRGQCPDELLDYFTSQGTRWPSIHEWNLILRDLVAYHLVPRLAARVETRFVDSCDNPVRAVRVDDRRVDWSTTEAAAAAHYFPPVHVLVPYVLADLDVNVLRW